MGFLVVSDDRQALRQSARRPELRGKDQPIRLVDLARTELFARRAKLSSRGDHGGPRPRATGDLSDTGGRQGTELRRTENPPALHDGVPGAEVTATRTNVVARRNRFRNLHAVVMFDNILDGDDGISSVGNHPAGRYRHRLAGPQLPRRGPPRRNPRHDRQHARRVQGADGVAVHRRARERRQVHERRRGRGQDAARRIFEPNAFRRQRARPFQYQALGLFERQQVRHDRRIRYAPEGTLRPP